MENPFRRKPKVEPVQGIEVLQRVENLGISMVPGDTLNLIYHRDDKDPGTVVLTEKVNETMWIDTALAFKITGALGLKKGIGGIFGESDKQS